MADLRQLWAVIQSLTGVHPVGWMHSSYIKGSDVDVYSLSRSRNKRTKTPVKKEGEAHNQ